jgi:hypothetical protein
MGVRNLEATPCGPLTQLRVNSQEMNQGELHPQNEG